MRPKTKVSIHDITNSENFKQQGFSRLENSIGLMEHFFQVNVSILRVMYLFISQLNIFNSNILTNIFIRESLPSLYIKYLYITFNYQYLFSKVWRVTTKLTEQRSTLLPNRQTSTISAGRWQSEQFRVIVSILLNITAKL